MMNVLKRLGLSPQLVLAVIAFLVAGGAVFFACGSESGSPASEACDGSVCDGGSGVVGSDGSAGTDGASASDGGVEGGAETGVFSSCGDGGGAPGTLDPSFGDGGVVVLPFGGGDGRAVAVQPNGQIVVVGKIIIPGSGSAFAVTRLNSNGTIDTAFGDGGVTATIVGKLPQLLSAVTLQPDGKILAAGQASPVAGDDFAVLRYTANGQLDPTFGSGGVVLTDFSSVDPARAMALMPDGRVLVAGTTLAADGDMAFARYKSDGSLDTSFGAGGKLTVDFRGTPDQARAVAVLPSGKILAAGTSRDPAVSRADMAAVRLNTDGSLDTTFANAGRYLSNFGGPGSQSVDALVLDPAGSVVLAGLYGSTVPDDFAILRLDASGQPDPTFGVAGLVRTDFSGRSDHAFAVLAQPGALLVAGPSSPVGATSTDSRIGVARHLHDGGLDPSFGDGGKVTTPLPAGFSSSQTAQGAAASDCGLVTVGNWYDEITRTQHMGLLRYRL